MANFPLIVQLSLDVMADIWEATEHIWVKWANQYSPLSEEIRVELMQRNLKYLRNLHPNIELIKITNAVHVELPGDDLMQRQVKEWGWLTEEEAVAHQQKGIEQGIEQGIAQATHKIAKRLIEHGLSDQAISQYTDLALDEVRELRVCC